MLITLVMHQGSESYRLPTIRIKACCYLRVDTRQWSRLPCDLPPTEFNFFCSFINIIGANCNLQVQEMLFRITMKGKE